jgi:hypothetical protein
MRLLYFYFLVGYPKKYFTAERAKVQHRTITSTIIFKMHPQQINLSSYKDKQYSRIIGLYSPSDCFGTCCLWHMYQLLYPWLVLNIIAIQKMGLQDNSTNEFALMYNTS